MADKLLGGKPPDATTRRIARTAAAAGLAALLSAPIASAENHTAPDGGGGDFGQRLEEFADDLANELIDEDARAAIERFITLMAPAMEGLQNLVSDLPQYEPPVVLPNGDILIRRRREGEIAPPALEDDAEESLEL